MKIFSNQVRDANLDGGREAAEALLLAELSELAPATMRLESALATYALFAENSWNDHELGARMYLAAAGATLAASQGAPRIEVVNLLVAAVDEFERLGDRGMSSPLAQIAHRLAQHTGRSELLEMTTQKLASLV